MHMDCSCRASSIKKKRKLGFYATQLIAFISFCTLHSTAFFFFSPFLPLTVYDALFFFHFFFFFALRTHSLFFFFFFVVPTGLLDTFMRSIPTLCYLHRWTYAYIYTHILRFAFLDE